MMKKINKSRARRGQRQLRWSGELGYVARAHAQVMARKHAVWHDQSLGSKVRRWRRLGQNTGAGAGCTILFRAFMRSYPHLQNIMGRWRFVGVGAKRSGRTLYVQQVFADRT